LKPQDASVPESSNSFAPFMNPSSRPSLAGKRIVVTRPIAQSAAICDALRACGAEPLQFPLIEIVPADDLSTLEETLRRLRPGDWIVFTSQNAVAPVAAHLQLLRGAQPELANDIQVAAIGSATERVAKEAGFAVQHVAKGDGGLSLSKTLRDCVLQRRVLIPRSDLADDAVPQILREFGAEVREAVVYRTEPSREFAGQLNANLDGHSVDAIVCFSPSAVHSLLENIGADRLRRVQQNLVFAAIGATTAAAFAEIGVSAPLVAGNTTLEGIVDTLHAHFAGASDFQSNREPASAGAKPV
jgi:uroporphyrinogen III methyltransferase / synthase